MFLFIFLISSPCGALLVSGKHRVHFEPKLEKDFELCVTHTKNSALDVEVYVKNGPLSEYVSVEDSELNFVGPGERCTNYHLELPSEVDVFGKVRVLIVAKGVNPNSEGGFMNVIVAMRHPLEIIVPWPGKYLSGSLSAKNVEEGEEVPMRLNIEAKGKETVESANSQITIFDAYNHSISTLQLPELRDIVPGNSTSLSVNWSSTGYTKGKYKAKAKVFYSNRTLEKEAIFYIGGLSMEVLNHTKNITNGSIKPIKVMIQSQWTEPIGEAYLGIQIHGKKTKTSNKKVNPWEETEFVGYVDATNFPLGETDLKITSHYLNGESIYNGKINIVPAPEEKSFEISFTLILVTIVVLLFLLNFAWIIYYIIRKNKKHNDEKQKTLGGMGFKIEKK